MQAIQIENFKVTQHSKICSEHFTPEDFKPHTNIRMLTPDAVPSIFDSHPRKKRKILSDSINEESQDNLFKESIECCRLCAKTADDTVSIFSSDSDNLYESIIEKYLPIKVRFLKPLLNFSFNWLISGYQGRQSAFRNV